jgi:DNA-binding NarL/FixJ family response regulator
LIVEDERIVALDLKLNLEALGFEVVSTVATEADAVRMAMSYRPDLVLMDISLEAGGRWHQCGRRTDAFCRCAGDLSDRVCGQ